MYGHQGTTVWIPYIYENTYPKHTPLNSTCIHFCLATYLSLGAFLFYSFSTQEKKSIAKSEPNSKRGRRTTGFIYSGIF